jgi:hypothetical protein
MAKVALCIIATNNYSDFVQDLVISADKYFLNPYNEVDYHFFSNLWQLIATKRRFYQHIIKHEPWPAMTLKRYHIMSGADLSGYDYVYYIDADMRFVAPVGDEIFGELVGVLHPGFYRGGGSWEMNEKSEAYVPPSMRKQYICGGFQGGSQYSRLFRLLKLQIDADEQTGNRAKWNDESHWNALYSFYNLDFTTLFPSYCMVEEPAKRKAWGIDHLEPKIIALKKDHKHYQK